MAISTEKFKTTFDLSSYPAGVLESQGCCERIMTLWRMFKSAYLGWQPPKNPPAPSDEVLRQFRMGYAEGKLKELRFDPIMNVYEFVMSENAESDDPHNRKTS